jgi:hypothetical protein
MDAGSRMSHNQIHCENIIRTAFEGMRARSSLLLPILTKLFNETMVIKEHSTNPPTFTIEKKFDRFTTKTSLLKNLFLFHTHCKNAQDGIKAINAINQIIFLKYQLTYNDLLINVMTEVGNCAETLQYAQAANINEAIAKSKTFDVKSAETISAELSDEVTKIQTALFSMTPNWSKKND